MEKWEYQIRKCPMCGKKLVNLLTWYNASNIPCEECAKKREKEKK